ncbi:hypothetical protein N8Z24_00305 [bacterium]|nr:hypothetical protein [bacterium]
MADVKINNNKYILGEDDFKITDGEALSDNYVSLSHDEDNSLVEVGLGSKVTNYSLPLILNNEETFEFPEDSVGYGFVLVGDGEEYTKFYWEEDGTVDLINETTNVVNTDTIGNFCIYDVTSTSVGLKNRLGTAKKVLLNYSCTQDITPPTFQVFNVKSGVDNLDPNLAINGTTVTPTFRYKGGDADGTDWDYWGYGEDLTLQAGTAPTYNDGSPGLGLNDDSVLFNAGGYYLADNNTFADVTTEDLVFECIFKMTSGTLIMADKQEVSGGLQGWRVLVGSGLFYCSIRLAGLQKSVPSATLNDDTWYHAICFINRDEASANGGQMYINGVASGAGLDCSANAGSITNTEEMAIGSSSTGVLDYNSNVAYMAMWKSAAWHQAGAAGPAEWATIAAERFAKVCGYYPQIANGTYTPNTAERTYPAYLDKVEDGYSKLYYVGSEWLRMCHRQDSNGVNVRGYLPETAATNLITESEDFLTTWSLIDAGDTVLNDQVVCPDGRTKAASIAGDATDGSHGVSIDATLTAATYTFSVFVKPGSDATYGKDWVNIRNLTVSNAYCYFDVTNGVVGTSGTGCTGYIEGPFYSGDMTLFYRCGIVFTGTVASHTLWIRPAEADIDPTFSGNGSTPNIYVWGAQCELGDYMTSPIITDGGSETRVRDELQYVAGDNIGGEDVGQGTVVFNALFAAYDNDSLSYPFAISDDDDSPSDRIYGYFDTNNVYGNGTRASGGDNGGSLSSGDCCDGAIHECRCVYDTDDLSSARDGVFGTADTACDMPDDLDRMDVGSNYTGGQQINGLIQNFRIYGSGWVR